MHLVDIAKKGSKYQDWLEKLPNDSCCYLMFDYEYSVEKRNCNKIILIVWCPISAHAKEKVLYAFSKKEVENHFKTVRKIYEADSIDKVNCFRKLIKRLILILSLSY